MAFPPRLATGLALRGQLNLLLPVTATVLLLGLAIDFAEFLPDALEANAEADGPWPLLSYAVFRGTDILLRQMPIIAIIAGFLAEIARIRRGETVILAAAGATVTPAVAAALILSMAMGLLTLALETRLRPAAVWAQVELDLGAYANRFEDRWTGPIWIDLPEGALRADLWRGAEPVLRDLTFLPAPSGPDDPVLIEADHARPAGPSGEWIAENARIWIGQPPDRFVRREEVNIDLGVAPLTLRYTSVPAFYLPPEALSGMREASPTPDLDTAAWRRILSPLLPGAFLLLGVALAAVATPVRGIRVVPLLGALFAAYLSTVALRVFWALGEMGTVLAPVAAAAPVVGVWLLAALLLIRLTGRRPVG